MEDIKKVFDSISKLTVGVIGDVMLDSYMWGVVDRISPEAPVPVVSLHKKEYRVGGAGNVALNCRALGAKVALFSVTGNDNEREQLIDLLKTQKINTNGILKSKERVTTNKTRIVSRSQQMLRLDAEITTDLNTADEQNLLDSIKKFIDTKPALIIFEDYNKGVLTPGVIFQTIKLCRAAGILTAVDPKRRNFFSYQGADIFKPNMKEVREGLNITDDISGESSLDKIHHELQDKLNHRISLITLSELGIFYKDETASAIIPSHLRTIADVSGAGDTVIAVASLVYAATKNVHLMAEIANIAGGIVCEEVGTAPVSYHKLMHECELLLS